MMHSVFLKILHSKRSFIIGWTIGMILLAALIASFYPAMHQEGSLDTLVKSMPAAFQGLVGNLADLSTFPTYIASQLFDIRVPLIVGIMAIILALGISVREEEDGELRTMIALPISRTKLLFEKWCSMVVIMIIVVLGLGIGVYAVVPFLEDVSIEVVDMIRLLVMTLLIMMAYGTVAFAAGMATGRRAATMLVGTIVIIGSFLLTTFGAAVDWLKDYEVLSLLHYFPATDIVKNGIQFTDVAVLLGITAVSLAIAWVIFRRRDVA